METEVAVNQLGLDRFIDIDTQKVIDVCGVGLRYLPPIKAEGGLDDSYPGPDGYEYGYNILRGIEVKVSRSDFRNGFSCSGCNYNYLLTPIRLVSPSEVPKGVGLIEFNRYKFTCRLNGDGAGHPDGRAYHIKGLRVVKRPEFRKIPRFQVDGVVASMMQRSLDGVRKGLLGEIQREIQDGGFVYRKPQQGTG